ncbi:MAG: hypothetical protein K1563_16155 [Candidatus Thiodiazotropha sp. (ex. Lucinisca nassula)]|nr:hypothetical protein [Candidatus Thiodiazotropha sp. (ex. Lucinisca nassula)]
MASGKYQALHSFYTQFGSHPSLESASERWRQLSTAGSDSTHSAIFIEMIDRATLFLEQEMQKRDYPRDLLYLHQQLFLEMEALIGDQAVDDRYRFIVVIPVADRPQHLQSCMDSLYQLCRRFNYGGFTEQKRQLITVLIADDSKDPHARTRIKRIQQQFTRQGLETIYFGQDEQLQLLDRLTSAQRQALTGILGNHPAKAFHHKGASITRNLSYLKVKQLVSEEKPALIWFIDSDQEFRVNTPSQRDGLFVINYFHRLDRIFTTTDTLVLTGKVVGDPPVSPAVMAGNFLRDVSGFVSDIASLGPNHNCRFHQQRITTGGDAAYHDMADLFGFHGTRETYRYQCRLHGQHDQLACFRDFSELLNRFFDGEHLTRQNFYTNPPVATELAPARTLYTGNYLLSSQALEYFIPFATLKLRMAGPQLGRIMKSELGSRFASANLPLLHKRTQDQIGESEFRAGIDKGQAGIDISGEFERQFFGDLMLFSLQALIESGYPQQRLSDRRIEQILNKTEATLLDRYSRMQNEIMEKLERLDQQIEDRHCWWWRNAVAGDAIENFRRFIDNMRCNFGVGSPGYGIIESTQHRQVRRQQILQALRSYSADRDLWRQTLSQLS